MKRNLSDVKKLYLLEKEPGENLVEVGDAGNEVPKL